MVKCFSFCASLNFLSNVRVLFLVVSSCYSMPLQVWFVKMLFCCQYLCNCIQHNDEEDGFKVITLFDTYCLQYFIKFVTNLYLIRYICMKFLEVSDCDLGYTIDGEELTQQLPIDSVKSFYQIDKQNIQIMTILSQHLQYYFESEDYVSISFSK